MTQLHQTSVFYGFISEAIKYTNEYPDLENGMPFLISDGGVYTCSNICFLYFAFIDLIHS